MAAPFQSWNWEDLPDVWKRLLDTVLGGPLLRAAAESMGYAPKEVYTRELAWNAQTPSLPECTSRLLCVSAPPDLILWNNEFSDPP